MRVQKLAMQAPISYTVLGDDDLPIPAVEAFLVNLVARGKAPASIKAYAHDLSDFFEWLAPTGLYFADVGGTPLPLHAITQGVVLQRILCECDRVLSHCVRMDH